MALLRNIFISARPSQWVKNLAVFAAIFFSGQITTPSKLGATTLTFIAFCFAASGTYFFNDLIDSKADQIHFLKKHRPIAAGKVSREVAIVITIIFCIVSLTIPWFFSKTVFATIVLYLLTQVAYNLFLKRVILLELLVIAFGFILRVFAGSFAVGISLSSWLILTIMMLSLFLAIGKRRSEVTLLGEQAATHRHTLADYPLNLLDGLVFISATSTLITYSLFTFNETIVGNSRLLLGFLPRTLASPKWLMLTIPIVVYGLFRYLYLIFEKKEGESPEKILLNDRPLLISVLAWTWVSAIIIYLLPAT